MKQREFEALCQAVKAGEERYLEHLETHHAGKVVACGNDRVEIDIYGKRESWTAEECKEFRPDANYME